MIFISWVVDVRGSYGFTRGGGSFVNLFLDIMCAGSDSSLWGTRFKQPLNHGRKFFAGGVGRFALGQSFLDLLFDIKLTCEQSGF